MPERPFSPTRVFIDGHELYGVREVVASDEGVRITIMVMRDEVAVFGVGPHTERRQHERNR